jgi:hypothetical protein
MDQLRIYDAGNGLRIFPLCGSTEHNDDGKDVSRGQNRFEIPEYKYSRTYVYSRIF